MTNTIARVANMTFVLRDLESKNSKIKVPAVVSGGSPLSGLQVDALLYSHMDKRDHLSILFLKKLIN